MRKINCSKICVDCVPNDIIDIRCGGPVFLGFDFYVPVKDTLQMIEFIKITLEELHIPLIEIYLAGEELVSSKNVFTKNMIVKNILKDKDYLIEEASLRETNNYQLKKEL